MGICWSGDVEGGKQAVGGAQLRPTMSHNNFGTNDAIDFFFRARGLTALFSQIELSLSGSKLLDRDITSKMLKLKDQDFLGEASCALSEIITKPSRTLTIKLGNKNRPGVPRNLGTLSVHAEETVASKSAVQIAFRCSRLENVDLFSKSDPFLRISRIVENGDPIPICKTEDNPLIIECFDFNSSGNHILLGIEFISSVKFKNQLEIWRNFIKEELVKISLNHLLMVDREKVLKGQLFVDKFIEKEQYSFLDYISSGFELNFMVAIDFTASNGNPRYSDSLHYIDPSGRLNSYQQAIMEVGEVIQFYDSDKRFPAWGFGGRTFDGTISHCFNLNGSSNGFEVEGVEGIMAAYANALQNVSLAGPTLFGQILDADNGNRLESSTGRVATRDIVQFVPMREVQRGQISVVQALLEELPGQFLGYVRSRDIKPLNLHAAQTPAL
ncbi:hypothetical protein Patl1_22783 [Pistacia atlantica]|uniref:Uncharacterized protein n=1 Tax=Pistacia atlantica TaxID=434234 RepID=A0ACC1A2W0_9ROSI|nr:hypothetical protein Patl1_22783 [Pistacia atlantica]